MTMPSPLRDHSAADSTKVSFFELFFDLIFVFALTRLTHRLLEDLAPVNALQTGLLLLAVWWCWMYTTWATNWIDPDHPVFRMVLTGVMLAALLMATSIPEAFEERAVGFALGYTGVQLGRTLYVVWTTRGTDLGPNFQRILCWITLACALWLSGAVLGGTALISLWLLATAVDLAGPTLGYPVPGLGRSTPDDWSSLDGAHMAERCQLFVIIALGESILLTGIAYTKLSADPLTTAAFAVAFLSTVAFWWIYFDQNAEASAEAVASSSDPGRIGRDAYTYEHIPIIAGVIVTAVGDELVIDHPAGRADAGTAAAVIGGAALFLTGHLLFKRTVFGHWAPSRLAALTALAVLAAAHPLFSPLLLAIAVLLVLALVALWDTLHARTRHPGAPESPEAVFD